MIRKGFEAFESKFQPFERASKHSNANSNYSNLNSRGFAAFEIKQQSNVESSRVMQIHFSVVLSKVKQSQVEPWQIKPEASKQSEVEPWQSNEKCIRVKQSEVEPWQNSIESSRVKQSHGREIYNRVKQSHGRVSQVELSRAMVD